MDYPRDGKYYEIATIIKSYQKTLSDWYKQKGGIGVVVVSDKQIVFVTQEVFSEAAIHLELATLAMNTMYDKEIESNELPEENVLCFIFESNSKPVFVLNTIQLSPNQYTFLCKIIDEIDMYNKNAVDAVEFWMFFDEENTIYTYDGEVVKSKLVPYIDTKKETHDNYIIGSTLLGDSLSDGFKK